MPAGWGHGGWATSSLVPSLSCLLFLSGSCPSHCRCLWINTIPAALQSKPGSSKIPQSWSTSSDLRSQLIYIRWPRVQKTLMLAMNIEDHRCNLYSVHGLFKNVIILLLLHTQCFSTDSSVMNFSRDLQYSHMSTMQCKLIFFLKNFISYYEFKLPSDLRTTLSAGNFIILSVGSGILNKFVGLVLNITCWL